MAESSLLPSNGLDNQPKIKTFRAMLGIQDKFQSAALKAIAGDPGYPKAKHISLVMEFIQRDNSKLGEFAVTCHALSQWADKHVICCKCLMTVLILLQTGPAVTTDALEPLTQYLSSIRDVWASEDMFLSQFAILLLARINYLSEHGEFGNHFNLRATSSNGLSLPTILPHEAVSVLSQMLSMQSRVSHLLHLGLKNQRDPSYFKPKERETLKCALFIIYEDAMCAHVASTGILTQIYQQEQRSGGGASSTALMRELYDEQFASLKGVYTALQDLANASSKASCYADMGYELSRCPEQNPLEAPLVGQGRASAALAMNIGQESVRHK